MGKLFENLNNNNALEVTSTIESLLRQKVLEAVQETRKQVAAEAFGMSFDPTEAPKLEEQIETAYEGTGPLTEGKEPDHVMAKELADRALHNHDQFHAGNHDARHGGWAMHDLHTWAKNYAKKADKGVYDKEKAVKGLTHAVKNSEPSYFGKAHHEKSGQTVSGATRTQAARHLLPHVEKLMDQHRKKKPVTEDEINEVLIPGEKLSPDQHKKVLSAFLHRHTGEHTPNWVRTSDDHHTPTHKTDKDWVHDHAFHFNKKTGSLAANRKYAEPHYMADNVKEAEITEKRDPFGFGKKDLTRLGAIDKSIKKEVAGKSQYQKDLEDWRAHDRGAIPKKTNEAEHSKQKPAGQEKERPMVERKPHPKQAAFDREYKAAHDAKDTGKIKQLHKMAWTHDFDLPWKQTGTSGKSPIHSFAEEEMIFTEAELAAGARLEEGILGNMFNKVKSAFNRPKPMSFADHMHKMNQDTNKKFVDAAHAKKLHGTADKLLAKKGLNPNQPKLNAQKSNLHAKADALLAKKKKVA